MELFSRYQDTQNKVAVVSLLQNDSRDSRVFNETRGVYTFKDYGTAVITTGEKNGFMFR
jgi:hypothetical protein